MRLRQFSGCSKDAYRVDTQSRSCRRVPGTRIVSDAWGAHNPLPEKGYRHVPVPIRGDPALAEDHLPIMHLVFANLKSWLLGCHHGVSPRRLQAYLNEYAFRFNGASTRSTHSGHCWEPAGAHSARRMRT